MADDLQRARTPLWSANRCFRELLARQRALTLFACAMLCLAIPTLVLSQIDVRTVREVGVWAKPLKFMASTALFCLTTTWFMGLLPDHLRESRGSRVMAWTVISTSLFEVGYISIQAALGSTSHHNVADPFHAATFGLMALAAVALTGTQAWLGWQIARNHAVRPLPIAVKAVIVGLVLTFVLSTASGFMLGAKQPPAGTGLPLTGWHVFGGDARPAHFLGGHAQQLVPLAGVVLQRWFQTNAQTALVAFIALYVSAWALLARLAISPATA